MLNERLKQIASHQHLPFLALLTKEVHVLPDFHGNRSPRADPNLKGMISGLSLDSSIDSLAILYLATIQSIAYGTKHIISDLNSKVKQTKTHNEMMLICFMSTGISH